MSAVSSTHICHIVSTYTDDVLNRQLLSNLSCSMSKDYEHTLVVLSKHQGQRLTLPNGVSCIELKNSKPLCWRSFRECKKILNILKPDICHTYGEVPLAMQWLAHRASISVKLHQLAPAQTEKDASWLSRLYLSALSHSTDVFISSSSDTHVWLKKKVKIAPQQCRLIRPAINARRFRPALQQVDAEKTNSFIGTVAIPTNKFVVGTDITHHAIEDVVHLIDEFAVACKLSPEFKHNSVLLIAGNARFLPLLRNEIQARNIIENNVRFAGEISDYYPFFNVIDALAIPTEIDTRSALLLEAMAMATPVISVRPKAIARRNEHPLKWTDKKGHCRVQHQLLDVFTDMTKRLRLGRESRLYVQEKHCAREYETRLLSLYEMARHAEHTSQDESAPRRYAASPTSRRE